MYQVNVALPSGKRKCLTVPQSSQVGDLRILAQRSFQQGSLQLVTAEGCLLADTESVVGLQDKGDLTAIVCETKVAANGGLGFGMPTDPMGVLVGLNNI